MIELDILLTYAKDSFPGLVAELAKHFKVAHQPAIKVELSKQPPKIAPTQVVIVTSRNGAKYLAQFRTELGSVPAAAIGQHTADELGAAGFDVPIVSHGANSVALIETLKQSEFRKGLLVKSSKSDSSIEDSLRESGWNIEPVIGYQTTLTAPGELTELAKKAKTAFIASPSAAEACSSFVQSMPIISVGQRTTAHLNSMGARPVAEIDVTRNLADQLSKVVSNLE